MKIGVNENRLSLSLTINWIICAGWLALLVILIPQDSNVVSSDLKRLFLYPDALKPEPNERLTYYLFMLSLLPISYLAIFLAHQYQSIFDKREYLFKLGPIIFIIYLVSVNWHGLLFWIRQEIIDPNLLFRLSFFYFIIS